jgi:hypothetical protein
LLLWVFLFLFFLFFLHIVYCIHSSVYIYIYGCNSSECKCHWSSCLSLPAVGYTRILYHLIYDDPVRVSLFYSIQSVLITFQHVPAPHICLAITVANVSATEAHVWGYSPVSCIYILYHLVYNDSGRVHLLYSKQCILMYIGLSKFKSTCFNMFTYCIISGHHSSGCKC